MIAAKRLRIFAVVDDVGRDKRLNRPSGFVGTIEQHASQRAYANTTSPSAQYRPLCGLDKYKRMDTNDSKRSDDMESLQVRIFIQRGLPGRTLVLLINYSERLPGVPKFPRANSKGKMDLFFLP